MDTQDTPIVADVNPNPSGSTTDPGEMLVNEAGEATTASIQVVTELLTPKTEPATAPVAEAPMDDPTKPNTGVENIVRAVVPPNAKLTYPTSGPLTSGSPDTIAIPAATQEEIIEVMNQLPNTDIVATEKQQEWAEVTKEAMWRLPMTAIYSERMKRAGSNFQQAIEYNNIKMRAQAPSWRAKPGTQEVEGQRAVMGLTQHLGVGNLVRVPLWASGFWVTFKPAADVELIELNRILTADVIKAGRWSYGLALSNTIVYSLGRVFEFALDHVYNTSVKSDEMPISEIATHLAPQDIMSFIWGYLCANYPSGFHYRTGCINDPTKCTHVIEANLNVSKLQFNDEAVLNDWQKAHMVSSGANTMALKNVQRYQDELVDRKPLRRIINPGTPHEIAITLKTPTITEYLDQGHLWIGGLVEAVNKSLGVDAEDGKRNDLLNKMVKATTLNQYIHWIDSIEYGQLSGEGDGGDEPSVVKIVHRGTISSSLAELSATDSIRDAIIKEVQNYIGNSTVSVIGVPAYDCPACGLPQDEADTAYPRHANIIPLDVLQVFFGLTGQRLQRIASRSDS